MKINLKFKMQNAKLRNFKIFNFQFSIFNSPSPTPLTQGEGARGRAGLTLVEVLVALTILSVGLLGVALMQITSISGNTFSREMAIATELGQDMLEKLNSLEYTNTALTAGNHPTATDVANGLAAGVGSANTTDERGLTVGPLLYTRMWNVIDNAPTTDMKTITVTVSWTERGAVSTTRSITITGVKVQT